YVGAWLVAAPTAGGHVDGAIAVMLGCDAGRVPLSVLLPGGHRDAGVVVDVAVDQGGLITGERLQAGRSAPGPSHPHNDNVVVDGDDAAVECDPVAKIVRRGRQGRREGRQGQGCRQGDGQGSMSDPGPNAVHD